MRMEAPPKIGGKQGVEWVYLHAYGGTKTNPLLDFAENGLSPCVWRHHYMRYHSYQKTGSISMRMEAPPVSVYTLIIRWVYLHAYGGTG